MKMSKARCIPQLISFTLNDEEREEELGDLVGCFIDRENYSIHWIHEKIERGLVKVSKSAQSF